VIVQLVEIEIVETAALFLLSLPCLHPSKQKNEKYRRDIYIVTHDIDGSQKIVVQRK
jgi:hypothetical protein